MSYERILSFIKSGRIQCRAQKPTVKQIFSRCLRVESIQTITTIVDMRMEIKIIYRFYKMKSVRFVEFYTRSSATVQQIFFVACTSALYNTLASDPIEKYKLLEWKKHAGFINQTSETKSGTRFNVGPKINGIECSVKQNNIFFYTLDFIAND